jgi:hypothetical protein
MQVRWMVMLRKRAGRTRWALVAVVVGVCLGVPAGAQESRRKPSEPRRSEADIPLSVERIQEALEKKPAGRLRLDVGVPLVTYRTSVEREQTLSFKEQLRKEFELNDFQRQSQEWASKGRGINLLQLASNLRKAYRNAKEKRIREEIARELAAVEEAARQQRR